MKFNQIIKQSLLLIVFFLLFTFIEIKADEPQSEFLNKNLEYGVSVGYLFGGD